MFLTKLIVVGLFIGLVHGQETPEGGLINSLPPELQGKIDEKQVDEIKSKATEQLKEKCLKNGGPGAYEKAENASKVLMECFGALVDKDQLAQEIEDAKPNGMVDEVFKKYCLKSPQFQSCIHDMGDSAKSCLAPDEGKHLTTFYNVTEQLAEFVCHKSGDRIALFIAEGGPECIKEQQEEIAKCANQTVTNSGYKFDQSNLTLDTFSIPSIAFTESDCDKFTELKICIVGVLEKCAQPTTANIAESLFKFIRKSTPCKNYMEKDGSEPASRSNKHEKDNKPASSASFISFTTLLLTATAFITLYV